MSPALHAAPRTFLWPLVIAAASLIGLVGALFLDGVWDGVGAALLGGATLAPIIRAQLRSRRSAP